MMRIVTVCPIGRIVYWSYRIDSYKEKQKKKGLSPNFAKGKRYSHINSNVVICVGIVIEYVNAISTPGMVNFMNRNP